MTGTGTIMVSCTGKEAYDSKAHAMKAKKLRIERAKGMRNAHKEKKRECASLEPYRCQRCHAWHLGTRHAGRHHVALGDL